MSLQNILDNMSDVRSGATEALAIARTAMRQAAQLRNSRDGSVPLRTFSGRALISEDCIQEIRETIIHIYRCVEIANKSVDRLEVIWLEQNKLEQLAFEIKQ